MVQPGPPVLSSETYKNDHHTRAKYPSSDNEHLPPILAKLPCTTSIITPEIFAVCSLTQNKSHGACKTGPVQLQLGLSQFRQRVPLCGD